MDSDIESTSEQQKPRPVRCDDPSTWRHKDERIDLPRLLELIEENDGPEGLDLHGADLSGLDARPEALRPYVGAWVGVYGPDSEAPRLENGIYLWRAHLENANLMDAHLENAFLEDAHLENALLADAHLENADLLAAHLENAFLSFADLENADLEEAHLENADLTEAHLENADLSFADLQNADLRSAHLKGACWYAADLDRTRLRREELGRAIGDELAAKGQGVTSKTLGEAREAYMALKTNFDSIGRYDDASWAYVKEQQMEKAMYFPTTAGHSWIRAGLRRAARRWRKKNPGRLRRFLRASILGRVRWTWLHLCLYVGLCPRWVRQAIARRDEEGHERDEWLSRWRWARNWAYELLAGYGEWLHMPVIWAGIVVLVFALIYTAAGNIASGDVGALQSHPTHSPVTAFTHSISAFATVGFNTLEPVGWGARLLTALEAMFGIGLFALFVFTLGNRMRRS